MHVRKFDRVQFNWVKGHAGNDGNELCDRLAGQAKQFANKIQDLPYLTFSEIENDNFKQG
jgi:ribonuclease HI